MFATHSLIVIEPCAKYDMQCQSKQKLPGGHEYFKNVTNLTFEIKDQCCTRHIFSWWYTHVQIWYVNVKEKKSYKPDMNLHRQKDKQTVISIYPPWVEIKSIIWKICFEQSRGSVDFNMTIDQQTRIFFHNDVSYIIKQEAHGPHHSPEKTVQINKNTYDYIITLIKRRKKKHY